MKKTLIAITAILIFISCYNVKDAVKQTNKAVTEYPDTTRSIFQKKWPVIITGTKKDSTEYKRYLQELKSLQDYYSQIPADTVYYPSDEKEVEVWEDSIKIKALKKDVSNLRLLILKKDAAYNDLLAKCKVAAPIRDTIYHEDKAVTDGILSKAIKSEKEAAKANKSKSTWRGIAIGVGIFALLLILVIVYITKRKK